MNKQEFDKYIEIYQKYEQQIRRPSFFIYLKTSTPTLLNRIHKRGRPYEQTIKADYLDTLGYFYDQFFEHLQTNIGQSRFVVCETSKLTPEQVYEFAYQKVIEHLSSEKINLAN